MERTVLDEMFYNLTLRQSKFAALNFVTMVYQLDNSFFFLEAER